MILLPNLLAMFEQSGMLRYKEARVFAQIILTFTNYFAHRPEKVNIFESIHLNNSYEIFVWVKIELIKSIKKLPPQIQFHLFFIPAV